jgi:hypothetical protein
VNGKNRKQTMLHGLSVSFLKRRLQKCQRLLGNGRDAELHLTMAESYLQLGEHALAFKSYQTAAEHLEQGEAGRDITRSNRLIAIYKKMLEIVPFDVTTTEKLGQEYERREMRYKAAMLYTALAIRFNQQGAYPEAIAQYRRVFQLEPGSLTARQACAELYCRIGAPEQGAQEYVGLGDIYFAHQRFNDAQQQYQHALDLAPQNQTAQTKLLRANQILSGTLSPQAQTDVVALEHVQHLEQTLAKKERLAQHLKQTLRQLHQRHQQAVSQKNQQLQHTQAQLEEFATYLAVLKDSLEQNELGKQQLEDQLTMELARKQDLEQKLAQLQLALPDLERQKTQLEQQLQNRLAQSSEREVALRESLEQHTARSAAIEQQLALTTRQRRYIKQKLQQQLHASQQREHDLQAHIQRLTAEHQQALQAVQAEKHAYIEKYTLTQAHIDRVEKHTLLTYAALHGELARQCAVEMDFSTQLHQSLQEITMLLHDQEQEIKKLADL